MIAATFVSNSKLAAGTRSHQSDTFQTGDGYVLIPLAFAHLRFCMVQAESFYLNGSVARFLLRFREVSIYESFGSTKVVDDNSFHDGRHRRFFDLEKELKYRC